MHRAWPTFVRLICRSVEGEGGGGGGNTVFKTRPYFCCVIKRNRNFAQEGVNDRIVNRPLFLSLTTQTHLHVYIDFTPPPCMLYHF